MEILKQDLRMMRKKSEAMNQITMDEDFNVPDAKPDVGRMIQNKGMVHIEEIKTSDGKILIRGYLEFALLYVGDQESGKVHSLVGKVPLEETLNLEGIKNGDKVCLKWDIEDLSIHLLNSRKLNLKAIISFQAYIEDHCTIPMPIELKDRDDISQMKKDVCALSLCVHKKDSIRIKENINLPSNKPNIHEVLWDTIQVRGLDMRTEEGKIIVRGEIFLFVLYDSNDESNSLQWMEQSLPFEQELECTDCRADLISNIDVKILQCSIEVKPDSDGEERVIQTDIAGEVDIKLYEEQCYSLLLDVYTPLKQCENVCKNESIEKLLVKNFSKCRVSERVEMNNSAGKVLQICHSDGVVKVDDTKIVDDGIQVEGVVQVRILYIVSDDEMPFYSMDTMIPFTHVVEASKINENCDYYLRTDLEQLSTSMLDSNEIEVKMVLNLNVLVMEKTNVCIIADIKEMPLDMEKMEKMPGIVGYKVQRGDSLWNIAKQFQTSIEVIKSFNRLESDDVNPGDTLILVKQVEA